MARSDQSKVSHLSSVRELTDDVVEAAAVRQVLAGRQIFEADCMSCHGSDRKGSPPAIPSWDGGWRRAPSARSRSGSIGDWLDATWDAEYPDAAYHLLDNKLCGDWQGESKCPEREAEVYEKYADEHPQSPVAAEASRSISNNRSSSAMRWRSSRSARRSRRTTLTRARSTHFFVWPCGTEVRMSRIVVPPPSLVTS